MKAAVPGIGVIYRLSVEDFFPGGLPFDEGRQIAIWAAESGADALHISAGHYRSLPSAQIVLPPMNIPDAPFLDFAAEVKKQVSVPVIAVGRLGDPAIAEAAVAGGKTDFIALGRTLIADPQWVERWRAASRCGAVSPAIPASTKCAAARASAAWSTAPPAARPCSPTAKQPHGERIAVIGAGPAGLTYASLVADGNAVTVFEKEARAGGEFPLRRQGAAVPGGRGEREKFRALHRRSWSAPAEMKNVVFRYATDVAAAPDLLAPFDRIVIATGATYRFGLGAVVPWALDSGAARLPAFARMFSSSKLRDWFYYRARRATADRFKALARPGQIVTVIGDAVSAGKSKQAITSAFEAALLGKP